MAESLDDPETARTAWARYRRMMLWMVLVAALAVAAAFAFLRTQHESIPLHMAIATVLGVGLTVLLGAGLMLLVFLSHGTGHDDAIQDLSEEP